VSNLDIYWETSTTGLISDLNYLISLSKPGAYSFVNVNYLQTEAQNPAGVNDNTGNKDSKYVTDWFYAVNYTSQRLNTATASLISVVNDNGISVSGFALESRTVSSQNSYRIKITSNFYFNPSINLNNFTFTLAVNDPVSSTTNNITIDGSLFNVPPSIETYTIKQIYSGIPVGYVITNTVYGVNGSFGPTSLPSTVTSGLKWSFLDGTQTFRDGTGENTFVLTIDPLTGQLSLTSGSPIILTTPTILLTDSGNATDTFPLTLNFTLGEYNPKEFNLDFNL